MGFPGARDEESPVWGSFSKTRVGSSSARRLRPTLIFSFITLVAGANREPQVGSREDGARSAPLSAGHGTGYRPYRSLQLGHGTDFPRAEPRHGHLFLTPHDEQLAEALVVTPLDTLKRLESD